MTDKERIEAIMSHYHLNNVAFCTKVGLNQATLSNILGGRTNPSLPVLRSVLDAFPEISPVWMFMDQGEMLAPVKSDTNSGPDPFGEEADLFSGISDLGAGGSQMQHAAAVTPVSSPAADSRGAQYPQSQRQPQMPQMSPVSVSDIVSGVVSQLQKPTRKIVEVRIFFDDGTFETFSSR